MENNLIILQRDGLRSLAKTLNALQLQIVQLEKQVRDMRLNLHTQEIRRRY